MLDEISKKAYENLTPISYGSQPFYEDEGPNLYLDPDYLQYYRRWQHGSELQMEHPWIEYKAEKRFNEALETMKSFGCYKLIETEEEFKDYWNSKLDCNSWCLQKLFKTMQKLGLGPVFSNGFMELIGLDLIRYRMLLDLAEECDDKDLLMWLMVMKFGGTNK